MIAGCPANPCSVSTTSHAICGIELPLPEGASFSAIERKSDSLGTVREGGAIVGTAWPVHRGRTTQVWDVEVADEATHRVIALFRCTELVLAPRS